MKSTGIFLLQRFSFLNLCKGGMSGENSANNIGNSSYCNILLLLPGGGRVR